MFTGRFFLDKEKLTQEMSDEDMELGEAIEFMHEKGMVPELSRQGKFIMSTLIFLDKAPRLSRYKFPKETREKVLGLAKMFIEVNDEIKEGKRKVIIIDEKGRVVER